MERKNTNFKQFQDFVNYCRNNKFQFDSLLTEVPNTSINFYRKGNKIQIKEKNKGSFTRYCGGNITEECIRKGKASSNPAIRKKSTFADNARKWNK